MLSGLAEFVVQGMTMEGEVFQPQDWAEQLCEQLAAEAGGSLASYVHPVEVDGVKSLVVRATFRESAPKAFNALKRYVADKHLVVRAGRGVINAEGSGPHRAIDQERRDQKRNAW